MKCTCENCGGTGTAKCLDCSGSGLVEVFVESPDFEKFAADNDNLVELMALAEDCARMRRQHAELCELNPARSDSYTAQLYGAFDGVAKQADKLWKQGGGK